MDVLNSLFQGAIYYFYVRGAFLLVELLYLFYTKGFKSDALSNVGCGLITYGFFRFAANGVVFGFFVYIASFATQTLDFSWWLLIATIFAADFSFYIYHVCAHKIRLFWTDHSVHHSSKEFDLTTNLRGTFVNGFYSWLPIIPLLLLGVHPALVLWCRAFVNDYTFFVHTQRVGKLGWLEWIFNTPSHHRVHHSTNPQYIDKNFGFMFIIWDRIFGTFAEENEACVYGIKHEVKTKNPVKIIFHEWFRLLKSLVQTRGFSEKLRVLVKM